jgi:hypothetical protein
LPLAIMLDILLVFVYNSVMTSPINRLNIINILDFWLYQQIELRLVDMNNYEEIIDDLYALIEKARLEGELNCQACTERLMRH